VPLLHETRGPWARIHALDRPALHFGRARLNRFDDPEGGYGVLYVADEAHGAFIETFGRQLDVRSISVRELSGRALSRIDATRTLRLVDLASSGGLARLSADARLTSGSADVARRWSRALWRHPGRADGIYYRVRHDPGRCGCALFDRASGVLRAAALGRLSDPAHRATLGDVLDTYGFALLAE
jgi:hypothetical protein